MAKVCKNSYKVAAQGPKPPTITTQTGSVVIQMCVETSRTVWDDQEYFLALQAPDKVQKWLKYAKI